MRKQSTKQLWDWWSNRTNEERQKVVDSGWWDTRLNDQKGEKGKYPYYIDDYKKVLQKAYNILKKAKKKASRKKSKKASRKKSKKASRKKSKKASRKKSKKASRKKSKKASRKKSKKASRKKSKKNSRKKSKKASRKKYSRKKSKKASRKKAKKYSRKKSKKTSRKKVVRKSKFHMKAAPWMKKRKRCESPLCTKYKDFYRKIFHNKPLLNNWEAFIKILNELNNLQTEIEKLGQLIEHKLTTESEKLLLLYLPARPPAGWRTRERSLGMQREGKRKYFFINYIRRGLAVSQQKPKPPGMVGSLWKNWSIIDNDFIQDILTSTNKLNELKKEKESKVKIYEQIIKNINKLKQSLPYELAEELTYFISKVQRSWLEKYNN